MINSETNYGSTFYISLFFNLSLPLFLSSRPLFLSSRPRSSPLAPSLQLYKVPPQECGSLLDAVVSRMATKDVMQN